MRLPETGPRQLAGSNRKARTSLQDRQGTQISQPVPVRPRRTATLVRFATFERSPLRVGALFGTVSSSSTSTGGTLSPIPPPNTHTRAAFASPHHRIRCIRNCPRDSVREMRLRTSTAPRLLLRLKDRTVLADTGAVHTRLARPTSGTGRLDHASTAYTAPWRSCTRSTAPLPSCPQSLFISPLSIVPNSPSGKIQLLPVATDVFVSFHACGHATSRGGLRAEKTA